MPNDEPEQSGINRSARKAARTAAQRIRLPDPIMSSCLPDPAATPTVSDSAAYFQRFEAAGIALCEQDGQASAGQEQDAFEREESKRHSSREVVAAILEGQPLEQIARLITDIVARRLQVARVGLYLRDERGMILPIALRNVSAEYGKAISRLVPLSPIANRAQVTGLPIFARDLQNDPQTPPALRELYCRENVTGLLMVMLQYEQRLAGTLVVYPDDNRAFSPADISAFQGLADMATLGIALSQQVQQQREFAMLEERNRLAREIHDTVAQSLAALILQMETLQYTVEQGDGDKAQQMLTVARLLAKTARLVPQMAGMLRQAGQQQQQRAIGGGGWGHEGGEWLAIAVRGQRSGPGGAEQGPGIRDRGRRGLVGHRH